MTSRKTSSHEKRVEEAKKEGRTLWRSFLINGKPNAPALLDEHQIQPGNIVVRRRKPLDGRFVDLFAIFYSAEDLFNYIFQHLKPSERDMYEIVEEKQYQKARFDIEFILAEHKFSPEQADETVKRITQEIKFITDNLFPGLDTGFREYSSHSTDKRSIHIVLTKLCHPNSQDARKFYELVKNYMSSDLKQFVDVMVYSTRQNFRLLYCAKLGSERFKTLIGSNKEPNISDFKESLLGVVSGCRVITL